MSDLIDRQDALFALGTITMYKGSIPYDTAVERIKKLKPALSTNLAEVGTDCISRQAAIDIIEDFPHGDVWNVESMEEMVDRIKQLPPIQPVNCSEFPNNSDTISRQAAIDAVRATLLAWSYMPEWRDNKIIEAVKRLPPIQPKRGRWIGKYPVTSVCSECGFLIHDSKVKVFAFCPNCGAKMEVTT